MPLIHPTAVIAEGADIAPGAQIGPYCVIGRNVAIGENAVLHSHVVIDGNTTIREKTVIYPFVSLGTPPQDLKFRGEASRLEIGARNVIREHVTMNPGTEGGGLVTSIGDDGLFMVGVHVAHDCHIGDHVVMANNATLAGHVTVGDHAVIGGLAAVHQFVRIGRHAMIGGMSGVEADVIPFGLVVGERAKLAGLNLIGMKRRAFDRETIHTMRQVYRDLFEDAENTLAERAERAREHYADAPDVRELIDFVLSESKRSICL